MLQIYKVIATYSDERQKSLQPTSIKCAGKPTVGIDYIHILNIMKFININTFKCFFFSILESNI